MEETLQNDHDMLSYKYVELDYWKGKYSTIAFSFLKYNYITMRKLVKRKLKRSS